jgi:hypothetical protein
VGGWAKYSASHTVGREKRQQSLQPVERAEFRVTLAAVLAALGACCVKRLAKRAGNALLTLWGIAALGWGMWAFYPGSLYIAAGVLLAIAAVVAYGREPIFDVIYLRWHVPAIMRVAEDITRQFEAELVRRMPTLPVSGGGEDMWRRWQPHLDRFVDTEIMPRLTPPQRELLATRPAVRKEVDDLIINMALRRMQSGT